MSGAHTNPTSAPSAQPRRLGRVHGPARFRSLARSRVRARSGPLRVTWSPRSTGDAGVCVAYAIPTSAGNAVQRNTVRRRLRDAFAAHAEAIPSGDILVRVMAPAEACTWSELTSAVAEVTGRIARQSVAAGGSR